MANTVNKPSHQDRVTLVKHQNDQAHIDTLPYKTLFNNCIRFLAAIFSEFDCKSCETNEHD